MTLKVVTGTAVSASNERVRDPHSPDALSARMPVDVRSVSMTVIAAIGVVLMLQYAQSVIIPIVLGILMS